MLKNSFAAQCWLWEICSKAFIKDLQHFMHVAILPCEI